MALQNTKQGRVLPALLLSSVSWYALDHVGPLTSGVGINPLAALCWGVLFMSGAALVSGGLKTTASAFNFLAAKTPSHDKGTWDLVKHPKQMKHELVKSGWGPLWGSYDSGAIPFAKRQTEIVIDFVSNATVLGVPGSGKGASHIIPNILAIRDSKTVISFKGSEACLTADALRERGENVRVLNLGDLWTDRLGQSDRYNIMGLINGCYLRPRGLLDVADDCNELNKQLIPAPPDGQKTEGEFFDEGGRDKLSFATQFCSLTLGESSTVGDVANLIGNRKELLRAAQWAAGELVNAEGQPAQMPLEQADWVQHHDPDDVENYIAYFRSLAAGVANSLGSAESKTGDSFLQTAKQSLNRFHKATRSHKALSCSTFTFSEQKEGDRPSTVFIIIDPSRLETQVEVASLVIWSMLTEWKRHPNKDRPVYLFADEVTNFKINGLGSLLTWGRGFGIRLFLYIQSIAAFRKIYGKEDTTTLLGTSDILSVLPGIVDPEDVKFVQDRSAEKTINTSSRRGNREKSEFNIDSIDYREETVPVLSKSEIMSTEKTILFVRKNPPWLVNSPLFAEIDPFRDQVGEDPHHKGRFLKPIKLRINRD